MSHGIDESRINHLQAGGDWLVLRVSVAEAQRMLNSHYSVYLHEETGERVLRTLSYSLPDELHSDIDMIAPTTYFSTLQSMLQTSFLQPRPDNMASVDDVEALLNPVLDHAVPRACSSIITPSCLRALYNTTDYAPASTDRNQLGVAGYLNEYANNADLQVR